MEMRIKMMMPPRILFFVMLLDYAILKEA